MDLLERQHPMMAPSGRSLTSSVSPPILLPAVVAGYMAVCTCASRLIIIADSRLCLQDASHAECSRLAPSQLCIRPLS